MRFNVRLDEVLSPTILQESQEHIRDFLLQEGIAPNAEELGATEVSERQIKELMTELAADL